MTIDKHLPAIRPIEPGDQPEQGRLTAPRAPGDDGQPPAGKVVSERLENRPRAEGPGERANLDVGRAGSVLELEASGAVWLGVWIDLAWPGLNHEALSGQPTHGPAMNRGALPLDRRKSQPSSSTDDEHVTALASFLGDPAAGNRHRAVGRASHHRIVGGDHHRHADGARQVTHQPADHLGALGVELARRLIGQQQRRAMGDCGAQCNPLSLTAGELGEPSLPPPLQTDREQQLVDP